MKSKKTSFELNTWNCISLLKCLAALLITNAHLGPFYPEHFKFLSFGGALGNSLFFFCSGWSLAGGVMKTDFVHWYLKRATRILIPVWTFMLITYCILVNTYHWNQMLQTPYWFLNAILLFYIPYYFIVKYVPKWILPICASLYLGCIIEFELIPHNCWMLEESVNDVYVHYWFYSLIMLLGSYYRLMSKTIITSINSAKRNIINYAAITLISFLIYMGVKYYIIHITSPNYNFQLFLPILLVVFAVSFYNLSLHLFRVWPSVCNNKVVNFMTSITLEIYVVQFTTSHYLVHLPFPIGLICNIFMILICAKILNLISSHIIKTIQTICG